MKYIILRILLNIVSIYGCSYLAFGYFANLDKAWIAVPSILLTFFLCVALVLFTWELFQ